MPTKQSPKAKKRAERAGKLLRHAASGALAADVAAGRQPYPAHLMPLSRCKTLNAEPKTMANYNPIGERGEQRHTPRHNVAEEDRIDEIPPEDVGWATEGWPSSCGTVVNADAVMRNASRLDRGR